MRYRPKIMDQRSLLIMMFGVGVVFQASALLRGNWNLGKILLALGAAALALLPGKHEHVYDPLFHALLAMSFAACVFAWLFREIILPAISEKVLLFYTLIFWIELFPGFHQPTVLHGVLLILALVPTAATLVIAFMRTPLTFGMKLLLYTWFLCLILSLGLIRFPFYQLRVFFQEQQVPWVTPIESLSAGMAFMYLAANATYIFELIPIPGKHQSWADRMRQWHEFTNLLTSRVDAESALPIQSVLVLLGVGSAWALNAVFNWLPTDTAINLLIALPAFLPFFSAAMPGSRESSKTVPKAARTLDQTESSQQLRAQGKHAARDYFE